MPSKKISYGCTDVVSAQVLRAHALFSLPFGRIYLDLNIITDQRITT